MSTNLPSMIEGSEFQSKSIPVLPKINDKIGDNIILNIIAEGGMSYVYKVKNEALEVIRVIKLIKSVDEVDIDRFITEARITANLNHPNIIQIYSFGKYSSANLPYLEMEYVDGINLHRIISGYGSLPIPVIVSILHYICNALIAVHTCEYTLYDVKRNGIVHRDIKPANIIIANNGIIKLADFGIAKPIDFSMHTSAVQVVGSPFYLSPEQLKKEELDFRADIYGLGCVGYEMTTGKRAFNQNNISDLVMAKNNGEYDKDAISHVPKKLKEIIIKSLNPLKELRYKSVQEIKEITETMIDEYSITNPQHTIFSYLQNPMDYHYISVLKKYVNNKEIKNYSLMVTIFLICIVSAITILYFYKSSIKDLVTVQRKNTHATVIASKQKTDSFKSSQPEFSVKARPEIRGTAAQDVNNSATEQNAYTLFLKKKYRRCISLLQNEKKLNDTLFLCYVGSLLETGQFERLTTDIKSRNNLTDAYFYYLLGRIEFTRKNFAKADELFQEASVLNSFYPNHRYHSKYYAVKSRYAQYLKKPNIQNDSRMKQSVDDFLFNYCKGPSRPECGEIITIANTNR